MPPPSWTKKGKMTQEQAARKWAEVRAKRNPHAKRTTLGRRVIRKQLASAKRAFDTYSKGVKSVSAIKKAAGMLFGRRSDIGNIRIYKSKGYNYVIPQPKINRTLPKNASLKRNLKSFVNKKAMDTDFTTVPSSSGARNKKKPKVTWGGFSGQVNTNNGDFDFV